MQSEQLTLNHSVSVTPSADSLIKVDRRTTHRARVKSLGYTRRETLIHEKRIKDLKEICNFLDVPIKYIVDHLIKSKFLTIETLETIRKTQKLRYTDVRE